jgi:hypothetical protein
VAEILALVLSLAFSVASTYAMVVWDRRRLPAPARARGWNAASTGTAVGFFAPLCIVAHFWVTRRSARGVLLGLGSLAALLAAQILFGLLLELVLGPWLPG